MGDIWDCVIVGGGPAGLSAALVLGQARRRTLLVDAGEQSNLPAHGIGGLLGHDGRPPAELYAAGQREIASYPSVEYRTGEVVTGLRVGDLFELISADGRCERTRRVLLATGMHYRLPSIRGLAPLWGTSVFHCPFCHGWEMRDKPLAVLARGAQAVHASLLLRGWSSDIALLTDGPADLGADNLARLAAAGIRVDERTVTEIISAEGTLAAIAFADGARLERHGLMVGTTVHQRSSLAVQLGVEFAEPTPISAERISVDALCRTSVSGVFAAGDLSAQMPQVASAIASGALAAAAVVQNLLADDVGLPMPE